MDINEIWKSIKRNAIENELVIKTLNGKEIIIDKDNKRFCMKCLVKDLQSRDVCI